MTVGIAGQLSLYDLLDSPPPTPIPPTSAPPIAAAPIGAAPDPALPTPIVDEAMLETAAVEAPPLQIEVTRSKRRRKTAQAQLIESVLVIRIPATCTEDEEQYFVDHFRTKFERSRAASLVDLDQRAGELGREYGLPAPTSIRWVSNQRQQWGSCTPADGTIRLSDRMAGFPRWVVDYVIVHELSHLVHADHSAEFWELVNRYPRTERARGYLLAKDGV